jgi:hypothetical protein
MIWRISIIALLFSVIACQTQTDEDMTQLSPDERKGVDALSWLKHADVEHDIQTALSKNDLRLLATAGRSTDLPGVAAEVVSKAKSVCGIRYVEGSTDVVQGETHLKMLQAAYDYADAYNREIIKHCLHR